MIVVPNGECAPVDAGDTVVTKGYLRDANGLTLIDHDVQRRRPFVVLLDSDLTSERTVTGLEAYDSILVKNFTGASITIVPNGDNTNSMEMADNEIMTFVNKSPSGIIEWSYMVLGGLGADHVYVYGYKEE